MTESNESNTIQEEIINKAREQLETAMKTVNEGKVENLMIMVNGNSWWMGNPWMVLGWLIDFEDVVKGQIWRWRMQEVLFQQEVQRGPTSSDTIQ